MKYFPVLISILLLPFVSSAQSVPPAEKTLTSAGGKDSTAKTPMVFKYDEQEAGPPFDMKTYLWQNLRYPEKARKKSITGRVIVKFTVNEDGSISDVNVLKGIGGGCDEEAKRVISAMPNWRPSHNNGKPVKIIFTQPITFGG